MTRQLLTFWNCNGRRCALWLEVYFGMPDFSVTIPALNDKKSFSCYEHAVEHARHYLETGAAMFSEHVSTSGPIPGDQLI